jgi:hypothetical protein
MQHTQIRRPNEKVKLFAKVPGASTQRLEVYEFQDGVLTDITPEYVVNALNPAYFSTEIVTPDHSCYLLILFMGNPIVLRVGEPKLQFFFWKLEPKLYSYKHFNEYGQLLSEGVLTPLGKGFYYYTPVSEELGYVEVLGRPYVIHVPYSCGIVNAGLDIDWKKTIKRQRFGVQVIPKSFGVSKKRLEFKTNTKRLKFKMKKESKNFKMKTHQLKFRVFCKS